MKIVTDRSQFAVEPGDVLEFSWARFGITRLPVRVTRADRGKILDNEITLDVAQDVFAFSPGSFSDPIDTGWIAVSSEAKVSLRERLWEVPFQLSLDNERHLGVLCSRDGGLHIQFDVFADRSGGTTFVFEGTELDFTPSALITAAISRDKGDVTPFVQDIEIDGINDVTVGELITAASTTIDPTDPANVILIDEELIFFETVLDLGGGLVRLETCHFGLFDTVPADHLDNAALFFIGFGVGLLQREGPLPDTVTSIAVKILPTTVRNTLAIGSAATLAITVGQRILNPIPPGDPFLNANRFHDLDGWTRAVGTLDFTWNTRNKATQDFDTLQDDPDLNQPGDVGARIIVRRVDTSIAVVDFDNIFSDQFVTTGFLPQSSPGIPDELDFTAEIVNRTVAGNQGQVAITREFEVFGFGIDFGADFGGEAPNNGIVLSQGAPPFVPEPIPGSGQDRAWTVDFLGAANSGENRRYLISITDTLNQDSVLGFSFFIPQSSFPTLEDMAEEFRRQTQIAADFPAEPMPFTITREGTQVLITTRFGDFSLRMQNAGTAAGTEMTPGVPFVLQEAAPAATPIQQVAFIDWFETDPDDVFNDKLSPTNDPAFLVTSPTLGNITTLSVRASTYEQEQEFGGLQVISDVFSVKNSGLSDARDQDIQAFYDLFRFSDVASFFSSIEGPLVLRGGLDNPMSRPSIVFQVRDNFTLAPLSVRFSSQFTAGGITFNAGGFKFVVKEGSPGVPGLPTGLIQVNNVQVDNRLNPAIGVIISYTLDGTVFSETIAAPPPIAEGSALRIAWIDLLDQIELDARFDVVNRSTEPDRLQLRAQIIATSPNTPFEFFIDAGVGLRIEFRDIST